MTKTETLKNTEYNKECKKTSNNRYKEDKE